MARQSRISPKAPTRATTSKSIRGATAASLPICRSAQRAARKTVP
ncbi:hypothetical protein M2345_002753 [Sphingobium sp. B8D3D]|nr:hypothetical protein [Sphingobium sp. B8D3D]